MDCRGRAMEVMRIEAEAIAKTAERLTESFDRTVALLLQHPGKVIVCGVGKSGFAAQKIAATLTSTGMQAVFLHPTEALHGDLGIYTPGDPTLLISRSGATEELLSLVPLLRRFDSPLIAIVGNVSSPLAFRCDHVLEAYVSVEADPLALVPTTSIITALAMGDALAAALMSKRAFRREDFARFHPGGQLGRNLSLRVDDVMYPLHQIAIAQLSTHIREVIIAMTERPLGACCVMDEEQNLLGIITDGDIRRLIRRTENLAGITAADVLCATPRTVDPAATLGQAVAIMEAGVRQVMVLPVVQAEKKLLGLIRLHDAYRGPRPAES
ncbi:MAG: KpsF/GutQ family sugar-phosphate isomerase [Puniceicoccales bacterium]|nr:KpsF/GutQ family sugar-phosphate isomerase [Puniceicoccales bacterium]